MDDALCSDAISSKKASKEKSIEWIFLSVNMFLSSKTEERKL